MPTDSREAWIPRVKLARVLGGYFTLGHYKSAPIRAHWSVLLLGLWFGRYSIAAWIALFVLILIHELGHAIAVRYFRHKVVGITITGFGGTCEWYGPATSFQEAVIAWGGVLAQALLYVATRVAIELNGAPPSPHAWAVINTFTDTNLILILINLLPFPPLDGAKAWPIFKLLLRRARPAPAPASLLRQVPRGPYGERPTHLSVVPDRSEEASGPARPAEEKDERFEKFLNNLETGNKDN